MDRTQKILAIALLLCGGAVALWGAYIPAKAALSQVLLGRAYERSVAMGTAQAPWPWAAANAVGKLTLPDGESYIILDQDHGKALAFAPGLVRGGDSPDAAQENGGSHVVIAAHRDTQFKHVGEFKVGDRLTMSSLSGTELTYQIDGMIVTDKDQAQFVRDDVDRLSLVTCWPLDGFVPGGPERLIISARQISLKFDQMVAK